MKGLTLTQPWATLVAVGAKRIETRSWPTEYRGPIAIHAAKGVDSIGGEAGLLNLCRSEPFRSALVVVEDAGKVRIVRGAILAVCELTHCIPTVRVPAGIAERCFSEHELAFGDYSPGRYAWVLENVRPLDEPIVCRGALGLWAVPDDVRRALEGAVV